LAHIINLATQAVISACSKAQFYSGDPDDDMVCKEAEELERNEVGLIRAICVKVCGILISGFLPFLTSRGGAFFGTMQATLPQYSRGPWNSPTPAPFRHEGLLVS